MASKKGRNNMLTFGYYYLSSLLVKGAGGVTYIELIDDLMIDD